ncbi:MAG: LegC family aminotransferase [Bdellovibrio sp.]|nr:LegC family aminotransferase [Bdellovibrio sp.]
MSKVENFISFAKRLYPDKSLIGLHEPIFKGNEKKYTERCIDSTFVSSVGEFVTGFEISISEFTKIPYAVACVNGTAALHMALILSGVEQNDEVLTQALTFVATANAISYCKAQPIFIDSDRRRLGMGADSLRNFLNEYGDVRNDGFCYNKKTNRRIKACVPMHVFGHPVDLEEILKICDQFKITLIEDAAESLGSTYKNHHTGFYGHVSILSFNGNKTITTGGGGMILTRDKELAARAKHLTTTAKNPHKWEFYHDEIGYNYRLPNINAALGVAQMEYLSEILDNKRKTAMEYKTFFQNSEFEFINEPTDSKSNFWLNAILLKSKTERDQFLQDTNENGVMTRPVWALMNELKQFSAAQTTDLTNAIYLRDHLVNIPSSYRKSL